MTTIARIKITNILGIDHLDVAAGKLTEFTGANGSGKTSALEAVRTALRGGHDATLLRAGQTQGEAVLILDDGTEITKRVTPTKTDLQVVGADGKKQLKPAATLDALRDLLSVNPVEFINAPKKDRVEVLLSSMPLALDPERVKAAIAPLAIDVPKTHPLVALEAVRRAVFDERTGTNRAAKEKRATVNQLANTIPPTMPEAISVTAITEEIAKLDAAKDARLEAIRVKLAELTAENGAKCQDIRTIAADRIREIEKQRDDAIALHATELADVKYRADAAKTKCVTEHEAATSALRAKVEQASEIDKARARVEQTRKTVEEMTKATEELEAQAEGQTKALENLEAYKSELLASLPIPGLTVVDGEVYRGGIPFDRLNTAQQIEIAVELAKLRAGKLGVICVDGMEALNPERYEEFRRQVLASGLQMFVTRATDGPFQVQTTNP
jgi:ABC-type cobalamin/Fe3+-siderophores transport system ATPase subunit